MPLRKQMFDEGVRLLTKKIIYVRRVRPKALDCCCVRGGDEPSRASDSKAGGIAAELAGASLPWVPWCIVFLALTIIGLQIMTVVPPAHAEHEVDHRFTVEGYVCSGDGQSVANQEVMVKDTRIPLGKTVYTDGNGFYSVTLHLHNDNQGDPILVTAGDREQRLTAKFDSKDLKAERKMTVNFGSGCEGAHSSSRTWVYYSVGLSLAGVAAFAGARMIRQKRRPGKRGKSHRK